MICLSSRILSFRIFVIAEMIKARDMKKLFLIPLMLATFMIAMAQAQQKVSNNQNKTNMESNTIKLTIEGGKTFTATLVDNSSTQALKEQLSVLGVETVCIDIPLCFPSIASYSTLSDRKLLELADLGFDISFIIVRSRILASDDEGARAAAVSECIAALKAAEVLSAPFLGILPEDGNPDQLIKSLSMIIEEAGKHGVAVAIRPEVGSAVDGFKGAVNFAEKLDKLSILLDPLALLHDDRENTFSFFEEVFSVLGSRIAALMLRDRLDDRSVNIGKGIMAKTYPRIAALLPHSMPLIRAGAEPATVADDIMYIRRVFF